MALNPQVWTLEISPDTYHVALSSLQAEHLAARAEVGSDPAMALSPKVWTLKVSPDPYHVALSSPQAEDLAALAEDGSDPAMAALAGEERRALLEELAAAERALLLQLLPKDQVDDRGVVLEVRPAAAAPLEGHPREPRERR